MLHRMRPALLAALVLAAGTAPLSAQTPAEILARYTRAIDPQGRIATLPGMRSTVTMEMPAAGMSANITASQSRPNLMAMTIEIPGLGQMRQGFDGTVAWSSDPMQGPRILQGPEASAIADNANLSAMARTPDMFSAIAAAGEIDVEGQKASCLKLTWKSGRETTECYSQTTGLLVESRSKQMTQMGEMESVSRFSDYRAVDGIMVPHKTIQSAMGMQQIITTQSVTFGAQDPKTFELPPEVRALRP